jgi:hypothetical protein
MTPAAIATEPSVTTSPTRVSDLSAQPIASSPLWKRMRLAS